MTQNEIIAMAREAGFRTGHIDLTTGEPIPFIAPASGTSCMWEVLRFAALVAAKEREACALVCESERVEYMELSAKNNGRESDFAFGSVNSAERIAAAICARGTKEGV